MHELIMKSLGGQTTEAEEAQLRRWRASSSENEELYRSLTRLWALTGVAAPEWETAEPPIASLIAKAEAAGEVEHIRLYDAERMAPGAEKTSVTSGTDPKGEGTERPSRRLSTWRRWRALGMRAAVFVGLGIGLGLVGAGLRTGPEFLAASEVVTGVGEMTTVTLGDGSSIRLGPKSRLRLEDEDGQRMAWLDGRAFFGVHADASRPFVVKTSYGEARVFGTRFEVRTEEEEFRVLVVEGSVAVSAGGSEVHLSESEMSRSIGGSPPSREAVSDVFQQLDWLGNALVFQATPVDRAFQEIERRYGVEAVIEDPRISDLSVTAAFTGQSVEDVVRIICETVGAQCVLDGDRVRVGIAPVEAPAVGGVPVR